MWRKPVVYDISMQIRNDMTVYKNRDENRPVIETVRSFEDSDAFESKLSMNLHTGTHIDMPLHMLEGGDTVDKLDIARLITPCKVFNLADVKGKITKEDLADRKIDEGDFILFKTTNSFMEEFNPEFVYVSDDAAEYLARIGISGVGIDSLGIERAQSGHPTHKELLKNGIIILEGLRLKDVPEGEYTLIALPLNIRGAEASPVRAVLLENLRE